MDDKALDEALKPLNTGPKFLAWVFKTYGENGVRELYASKLTERETITKWSRELRALQQPLDKPANLSLKPTL